MCSIVPVQHNTISVKTVKNCLSETHLHACHPFQGLDLTTVRCRDQLECANAYLWCHLALYISVLFGDESWFVLYQLDGRKYVWHCLGEQIVDVNFVPHGGAGTGISYRQWTWVHFINGILNAQRYHAIHLPPSSYAWHEHDNAAWWCLIMHCPKDLHRSWEHHSLCSSCMACILNLACHPLSMFEMLWTNSVFQFLAT